jgi:O-antigen/teichoic acid export membrane protein
VVNLVVIAFMKLDIGDNILVRIQYNYIVETLILLPFLFIYFKHISFRFNITYVKNALYIGLPAMFSGIIGVFYSLADRKFIEQYRSHEELGIYTLGIVLSGIIYLIFAAFQNSLLPFFYKEKDKMANYERTIRATKKITLLLIGFSIAMFLLTVGLIQFQIIKPEYKAILPIMPIMLLTQIIQSISALFANYFIYFNKNYYSIFLSILSAILNILLCMLFIPSYGIAGAVAATFVVSIALCTINFNFARKLCLRK